LSTARKRPANTVHELIPRESGDLRDQGLDKPLLGPMSVRYGRWHHVYPDGFTAQGASARRLRVMRDAGRDGVARARRGGAAAWTLVMTSNAQDLSILTGVPGHAARSAAVVTQAFRPEMAISSCVRSASATLAASTASTSSSGASTTSHTAPTAPCRRAASKIKDRCSPCASDIRCISSVRGLLRAGREVLELLQRIRDKVLRASSGVPIQGKRSPSPDAGPVLHHGLGYVLAGVDVR
jgi:hypothetical protein